ncbi:MAG: coproporphyrinogen III oxidase family protein [Planctomycetes bacterium]|nr:coproporphyrinogen III oxidase family protein [Planctomycetota bacterium]
MELDLLRGEPEADVGSYFVANYPPFSVWSREHVSHALQTIDAPAREGSDKPVGLYLHIPFCRKRCKFCYYRVYTDKNSDDVETYLSALTREVSLYADRASLRGRTFEFVYFGGGTPSFLSSEQLRRLIDDISKHWSWERAREVTFECEPGTLRKGKLQAIKEIGTTRLSLGVEHFDDEVLSVNGRAHKSLEIFRAFQWARDVGFDQINLDLIAGMVGDEEGKWKDTVAKTLELAPDSVTIYQMEVPFNSVLAREARTGSPPPAADWPTKRAWMDYAFAEFEAAGYEICSAYTVVKRNSGARFVYRDALWHGSDMIGTGVASFSHLQGVHFQNEDSWEAYVGRLERGELPLARALPVSRDELMTRELVLQLKLGRLDAAYFRSKFGVEITRRFAEAFGALVEEGYAEVSGDAVALTRTGLLRADGLLPRFFEPRYRNIRYS